MKRFLVGLLALSGFCGCGESSSSAGGPSAGASGSGTAGSGAAGAPQSGGSAHGGSAGASVAGGGGAGGTVAVSNPTCDDVIVLEGNWSQCHNDLVHRSAPGACPFVPSDEALEPQSEDDECLEDGDCNQKPAGWCNPRGNPIGPPRNTCVYGCIQDADCGEGELCTCAATDAYSFGEWRTSPRAGQCHRKENCGSDADCGAGLLCVPYDQSPGCYSPVFACQTPQDECSASSDCPGFPSEGCTFNGTRRVCQLAQCAT